jgi:hypothetical protein
MHFSLNYKSPVEFEKIGFKKLDSKKNSLISSFGDKLA